jgi:hypothetical protein
VTRRELIRCLGMTAVAPLLGPLWSWTPKCQIVKPEPRRVVMYEGEIQNFAAFRRALTPEERALLYNDGKGLAYQHLKAWWDFDQPSGEPVNVLEAK